MNSLESIVAIAIGPPVQRRRVLLIDDEDLLLRSFKRILEREYEVVVAHSALEGLSILGKQNFDLILCDLSMPVVGGYALYRLVRLHAPAIAARFVMISGGTVVTTENQLRRAGVPLLDKPFGPEEVRNLVNRPLP